MTRPCLAIHGGAGVIAGTEPELLTQARSGLGRALAAGRQVLEDGGAALAAVEAAVRVLEDDPSFNAGRGSALTLDGTVEMDAAIMDGRQGAAGAVTGLGAVRHPVEVARLLLEHGPHVLMAGAGAERFAVRYGAQSATQQDLITPRAREQLARFRATQQVGSQGTVGAVACDRHGHLAAATSTGGTTGKLAGRVGDSPIIGAGTWADRSCAISATGLGETFIRTAFAHAIASRIESGVEAEQAVRSALAAVRQIGGNGGCIVALASGATVLLQHDDMFRAAWQPGREMIAIFGGDAGS